MGCPSAQFLPSQVPSRAPYSPAFAEHIRSAHMFARPLLPANCARAVRCGSHFAHVAMCTWSVAIPHVCMQAIRCVNHALQCREVLVRKKLTLNNFHRLHAEMVRLWIDRVQIKGNHFACVFSLFKVWLLENTTFHRWLTFYS